MHPMMVIIQSQIMYRDKMWKKLEFCFESKCKLGKARKVRNICYNYHRQFMLNAAV